MTKYTFIMEDDDLQGYNSASSNEVVYTVKMDDFHTHVDLAAHFRQFLEGCGYRFSEDFELVLG